MKREQLYDVVGRSGELARGLPFATASALAEVSGGELYPCDDASASRRVDVLALEAPHLIAPDDER